MFSWTRLWVTVLFFFLRYHVDVMGPINIVFEYQIILISGRKSMQPFIEIVSDAAPVKLINWFIYWKDILILFHDSFTLPQQP